MSRPSSTSTASAANAFPRPAGVSLNAPEVVGSQLSPARSTFSFDSSPKSATFADRGVTFDSPQIPRPDSRSQSERKAPESVGKKPYGSRRRTQYYEEQFAYKDETSSARDRVQRDSPVIAELKTNVIIKDEYTLVTDLSHHLSARYQRPESSIMITVTHSACLLLGGSFEPTYILTVTALPTQVLPATNKRNAALTQGFLKETLGVHPERGIIKFLPIPPESLATSGMTILGEMERSEREYAEENSNAIKRALTKSSKRSIPKSKSSFQLSRGDSIAEGRSPIPSPGPFDSGVSMDEKDRPNESNLSPLSGNETSKNPTPRKSKSSANIISPTESKGKAAIHHLTPPPIPEEGPSPRVGKRKSFMTMFKR